MLRVVIGDIVLVVTGMHRSGTSSVAMTMEALGIDFGPHTAFYEADEWNPEGYFERSDVIDCNSRLLTGVARTEGRVSAAASQVGYLLWASATGARRRARDMGDELDALAARLEGLAVKDPRFCLTLDAWGDRIERTVVVLRHPSAVAASLSRRQHVPTAVGLRFWDRHARGLLDRDGEGTCYVDFDELSTSRASRAAELARLVEFLGLGLGVEEAVGRFEQRFSAALRHFEPDDGGLPATTAALWRALQDRRVTMSG